MADHQALRKLTVLYIGTFLLFFSFQGMSMLQSTMNGEEGIGVISQAVIYTFMYVSSLLSPTYLIQRLGCKTCIALSSSFYLPFVMSNFHPVWEVMIPTSALLGVWAPIMWCAYDTYIARVSLAYVNATFAQRERVVKERESAEKEVSFLELQKRDLDEAPKYNNGSDATEMMPLKYIDDMPLEVNDIDEKRQSEDWDSEEKNDNRPSDKFDTVQTKPTSNNSLHVTTRNIEDVRPVNSGDLEEQYKLMADEKRSELFRTTTAKFYGLHAMSHLSSVLLSSTVNYFILSARQVPHNFTVSDCNCGASFCNEESMCFESNISLPDANTRYLLTGIFSTAGVLAVLVVVVFLEPLQVQRRVEKVSFSWRYLTATCRLAARKESLLLVPLIIHSGLARGFFTGDFNRSYIGCAWGTHHVGLVSIGYGLACSLSSAASGWLVKWIGRIPVIAAIVLLHLTLDVLLLNWIPQAQNPEYFFLYAALWGVYPCIVGAQLKAFNSTMFKKDTEAAFATFMSYSSIGFFLSFAYSNFLCTYIKLYIMIVVSSIGFIGYILAEKLHKKNKIY